MLRALHTLASKPIAYLQSRLSDRHFFILSAILVGFTSGFAAIVLKYVVHSIESLVRYSSRNYENFILFAAFPLVGITLTVLYLRYVLKKDIHKGSAEIVYSIIKKSSKIPPRESYSHVITSGLTVGFGGSLGLESPMVSTGAAVGSNFAATYGLSYKDRTVLLGCGAAAGIAAAFNAPIAGVLFAIEVLLADVTASAFIPLIISAATGALMTKIILKEGVILTFSLQQPFNYHNLPFYILLGILAGIVSLCYARIFSWVEHYVSKIPGTIVKVAAGGALLFVLIVFFPPLFGEGYHTISALAGMNAGSIIETSLLDPYIKTEGHLLLFLGALIFLKIFAAAITLGSGGNGGSFAPSLFVGAYLGYVFSRLVNLSNLSSIPESNFTLVAMAGILSGVFYAPLTAIFLIAELTGGYELMIPLMIVSSLSLVVAHFFQPLSMEGKKLSKRLHMTLESRDKVLLSRLELSSLVENNFSVVRPGDSLRKLVNVISASTRNMFPVVDDAGRLVGIIHLDKIRQVIFEVGKYDTVFVKDVMSQPVAVVEQMENLHQALEKFDRANQWNLPVVDNGRYVGFLSKSSILTRYRDELVQTS